MPEFDWHAAYGSDLQSVYALLVAPLAFLAWRLAAPVDPHRAEVPRAARFVSGLTLCFAVETLLDPIATGPMLKLDFFRAGLLSSAVPFVFVLLGDLRVLLLALGVARPDRGLGGTLLRALGIAMIVPIVAGGGFAIAGWIWPALHAQVLWMLYELAFLLLCVVLGRVWLQRDASIDPQAIGFLRSVFGYSAAYYALWLFADLAIVGGGLELGWALRMVPNQLYYAFWVPFVYWRFFCVRPEDAPANAPA